MRYIRKNFMRRVFVGTLILCGMAPLAAQDEGNDPPEERFEPTYSLGDQMLSLNLGAVFPLFYTGGSEGLEDANLTVGGTGHLQWSACLNNNLAIGGEFGGMFAFTPNQNTLFMIPLATRLTYFLRAYPFEFPLSLAACENFTRY